jgi:hypothetical protein
MSCQIGVHCGMLLHYDEFHQSATDVTAGLIRQNAPQTRQKGETQHDNRGPTHGR